MAASTATQPTRPGSFGHAHANCSLKTGFRIRDSTFRNLGSRPRHIAGRPSPLSRPAHLRRSEGHAPAGRASANPCAARWPGSGFLEGLAGRRRSDMARRAARRRRQGERRGLEFQPASDAGAGCRHPSPSRRAAPRHCAAGGFDRRRGATADAATARSLDRIRFRHAPHADETSRAAAMPQPRAGLPRVSAPATLPDGVPRHTSRNDRARSTHRAEVPRPAPRSTAARTPRRRSRRPRSTRWPTAPKGTGKARPAPPAR